jgi:hypothetical protein
MPALPEVIIDGHKVAPGSKEAVAELYELINMSNIAKMRTIMADQVPEGWVEPYDNHPVTPAGEIIKLRRPGQAISLINDGAAAIQIGINSSDKLTTVAANQAFNLNFHNHKLEWFYLICGAGLAATVRVTISG